MTSPSSAQFRARLLVTELYASDMILEMQLLCRDRSQRWPKTPGLRTHICILYAPLREPVEPPGDVSASDGTGIPLLHSENTASADGADGPNSQHLTTQSTPNTIHQAERLFWSRAGRAARKISLWNGPNAAPSLRLLLAAPPATPHPCPGVPLTPEKNTSGAAAPVNNRSAWYVRLSIGWPCECLSEWCGWICRWS